MTREVNHSEDKPRCSLSRGVHASATPLGTNTVQRIAKRSQGEKQADECALWTVGARTVRVSVTAVVEHLNNCATVSGLSRARRRLSRLRCAGPHGTERLG